MFRSVVPSFHRSVVPVLVAGAAACIEYNPKLDEDVVVQPRWIQCGDWECTAFLTIDGDLVDELAACYNWDPVTGWPQGTPQAIIDAGGSCNPGATGNCVIPDAYTSTPGGLDAEECPSGCAEGEYGDPAPAGCCLTEAELETEESSMEEVDDLLEQINDDCGSLGLTLTLEDQSTVDCTDPSGGAGLTDECPTSSVARTPGADYLWEVDPLASTLTVHTTAGEDTVSLSGLGAAQTGPNEFLAGIVDAGESAVIGSDTYANWRFWFTADISMSAGGGNTFTVPVAQGYEILARGQKNGTWANAVFDPTEDADGTFDATAGTWSLDYTSTFTGGWVDIHLEGDAYGASIP